LKFTVPLLARSVAGLAASPSVRACLDWFWATVLFGGELLHDLQRFFHVLVGRKFVVR
jgi:hypothetical protein